MIYNRLIKVNYSFIRFIDMTKFKLVLMVGGVIVFLSQTTSIAQYNIDYGFKVGPSNYLGEMGGGLKEAKGFLIDMELSQTRWSGGVFFRYRLNRNIFLNTGLNYLRIQGSDQLSENPNRIGRNLNFVNDLFEYYLRGEYKVYNWNDIGGSGRYLFNLQLFTFAGTALTHHSPRGKINNEGKTYWLRPLATEGHEYSKIVFSIPLGGGIHLTYKRKHRFGLEINYRMVFTDYLDDVSSTYVKLDGIASKLGNQTEFIDPSLRPASVYYLPGSVRGNPKHNDSYLTASFTYSHVLRGRSSFYSQNYGWLTPKRKSKRRKVRAKF